MHDVDVEVGSFAEVRERASAMPDEELDGTPIDPDTALRVILDGVVRFVVHDDAGVPIHWG